MKEKLQEYITKNYLPDIRVRSKKSNIITTEFDKKNYQKRITPVNIKHQK